MTKVHVDRKYKGNDVLIIQARATVILKVDKSCPRELRA